MSRIKTGLLYLMAFTYMYVGFDHLANPDFYIRIIPPTLPMPEMLNLVSGLAEIVLGAFLLDSRTRPFAALGVIALLVAVFPANVYMATANVGPDGPGTGAGAVNWVRLPFQLLFAAWAWWYVRPEGAEEPTS
ncbi:MAG: DoxX family membrane protein [Myxococcota bacterium]|nr:DoxX family membrane protein [Myxococcota bacterium]